MAGNLATTGGDPPDWSPIMTLIEEIRTVAAEADCLYSKKQVQTAITEMAKAITTRLEATHPLVLCVLNGGIVFTGELLLQLQFPLEIDSIKAGRYQGDTRGSHMRWSLEPAIPIKGRTVLILDDILDEGITLAEITRYCRDAGAEEIFAAVLIDKHIGRIKPCSADFIGLRTENRYLFGYGLDYKSHLRNWPGIYACTTIY
jgi:hypoxanthine phosphoribosyltransferase